jgi:DNA-binding SARP family transcriptional activator/predicted ATPase
VTTATGSGSSLIGRASELTQIDALLHTARVVTLVGPPGVGKTTLATDAARRTGRDHTLVRLDGVVPAQVATTVAGAVGAAERPGRSLADAIAASLADRDLLLVLDSCENVLDGIGPLVDALVAAPNVTILATSRQPLNVGGEVTLRVPPLRPADAVELLRARSSRAWSDDEAAALVASLDHLPLAVELAAASDVAADQRDDVRGPIQLALASSLAGVTDAGRAVLALLCTCPAGVPRDAVTIAGLDGRQIDALVDASLVSVEQQGASTRYRVIEPLRDALASALGPDELEDGSTGRTAWCRHVLFEVFGRSAGTRDEPAAMAALDVEQPNIRLALTDALAPDVDDGCFATGVQMTVNLGRYWLLRGRLEEADGWLRAARARRTDESARLASTHGAVLVARGLVADAEAAYNETARMAAEGSDHAIEAAGWTGLGHIAFIRGEYAQCAENAERAIALSREHGPQQQLLTALHMRGTVARLTGDYDVVERYSSEGLEVARAIGDRSTQALALLNLGAVAEMRGDRERAKATFEECVEAAAEVGHQNVLAAALGSLGALAAHGGDFAECERLLTESLEISRRTGDVRTTMITLTNLSAANELAGQLDAARTRAAEALAIARQIGDRDGTANVLGTLGEVALAEDDLDSAASLLGESLAIRRQLGDKRGLTISIENAARLAARRGDHTAAARLLGAADGLRERIGHAREPTAEARHAQVERAATDALGHDAAAALRDEGRSLALLEMTTLAEEAFGRVRPSPHVELVAEPTSAIAIKTLGGFAVIVDGEPVAATAWQSRKARDLLKVLVTRRGQPVARDVIAEQLWPDADDPSRLRSRLSVVLTTVRNVLVDPAAVVSDKESVALSTDVVDVDVERFLAAVASGDLAGAEALYTGEFLPEDVFADWSVAMREEVRLAYVGVARELARDATGDRVLTLASRILEQDAYDDEAHRLLIASLHASGRHGDARRAHERFAKRMDELGLSAPPFDEVTSAR